MFKAASIFIFAFLFSIVGISQEEVSDSILSDIDTVIFPDISDSLYLSDSTIISTDTLLQKSTTLKKSVVVDSNAIIYGWKLSADFLEPIYVSIDTSLTDIHMHNPVLKEHYSLTSNGSNGAAYLSNDFFKRNDYNDLLFLNSYEGYFNTYHNTVYINTKKPYTYLEYIFNWPKANREEYFNVQHSQNVNERLNFGFNISFIADKSQIKYQNVKNKSFNIFSSYLGDRYSMHTSLNLNRYQAGESGGVVDSLYKNDVKQHTKEIETNFTGGISTIGSSAYTPYVTNRVRYMDGMLSQSIKLFTIGGKNDSLKTSSSIAEPILSHIIRYRRASKIYENSDTSNNYFYDYYYSNYEKTYDSISEIRVTNTIQLDFQTKIRRKVLAGIYGNISHDYIRYSYYSELDTNLVDSNYYNSYNSLSKIKQTFTGVTHYDSIYDINKNKSLSNIYVSGGIYGQFWTHFKSKFSATVYLSGYKAGQTKVDGLLQTKVDVFKKPYKLDVYGSLENIVPSYLLNNYYSNNYIWENDFNPINRLSLSSKLAAPSNKFDLVANYTLIRNYIYYADSTPVAYEQPLSIMAFRAQKEFEIWKLHSLNKLTYQVSENRSIVEIPSIIYFNSTYIDHTWKFKTTGGSLRTLLGVDVYYSSSFNSYNYIPALSTFYQQTGSTSVGNYPFVDLWLNIQLKRTRFFFKYENININNDNKDLYYAVNYPVKIKAFKFGLSWTFYD